jgi:O-antigen/teichoic acid export membrane protein
MLERAVDPNLGAAESELGAPQGRSLGRAVALLSASQFLQIAGSFVFSIVMRGVLGPVRVGVWNYVDAWRQQLAGVTFGLHYAADREMPMLRAQGRSREEDEIRWLTFTWTIIEALVLAGGFWVYWLIDRGHMTRDVALGLGLVPILATLTSVVSSYEQFLVVRKHFELRAWLAIGLFFLDWSLLLFVWLGGLTGLLWGLLVTWSLRVVISAGVIRWRRLFSLRFTVRSVRRRVVVPMLKFGFPVSVFSFIFSLIQRLDSLVIGAALGTTQLGFYYLGPQVAASLATLPNMLSVVSYPNLMETYGRHGMASLKAHIKRFHQAMLVMSPAAAAIGVFSVQLLVEVFLPAFRPGLAAMKIVIVSVVFSQTSLLSLQIFLATKRVALLMGITVFALAVQGAVLGAGALSGLNIEIVAWSAVAGQAAFAVVSLAASARLAGVTVKEALDFWARLPLGWIGFAGLILAIDAVSPNLTDFAGNVAELGAKLAVFTAVAGALLWLLDRGALRASRELMATRTGR